VITAAFWISGRACHRALTGQQFVELALPDAMQSLNDAARDVSAALAEPSSDTHVTGLLVAAESCRRAGALSEEWTRMLVALVGTPWQERLPPTARMFVAQQWPCIQRVTAELLYDRRVLVSRVLELCNVRQAA
jgi:hypothetical protein